jgi:hypothetical protein
LAKLPNHVSLSELIPPCLRRERHENQPVHGHRQNHGDNQHEDPEDGLEKLQDALKHGLFSSMTLFRFLAKTGKQKCPLEERALFSWLEREFL